MNEGIKAIVDYGIYPVAFVAFAAFLVWLIKYILKCNREREERYIDIINGDLKDQKIAVQLLANTLTNFAQAVSNAHEYQRQEHKDQIATLSEVVGGLQKVCAVLSVNR